MQIQINQILAASARYITSDGTTVTGGIQASNYQSTVGILPVVGDFFVNPATPLNKMVAESKSLLINGERLYRKVQITLKKLVRQLTLHLQRLSEEGLMVRQATVRTLQRWGERGRNALTLVTGNNIDPYNTAGSSGPAGGPTSSIYLLQLDEMSMIDLMPIGRTELAKIADTIRFYISEYSVLAVKLLRHVGATLHEKIRYIGEGLSEAASAVVEEIIPREVVYHSMLPRREHTRIAL